MSDQVKKYLPYGNSAAILCTAFYFYKENKRHEEKIADLMEGMRVLHKMVKDAEKRSNRTLKEMNERVNDVERFSKSSPAQSKKVSWGNIQNEKYQVREEEEEEADVDDITASMEELFRR